jgi:hypothetical protein
MEQSMPSLAASNGDDDARDRDGNLLPARAALSFIGFVLVFDCGYSACTWGLYTRSNACYYGADLATLPGRRDGGAHVGDGSNTGCTDSSTLPR